MTAIKTRQPTGRVPWPLILIEGPEKSGKSWTAAEFSASEKIGQTYWLDLGEGSADEYGAIPGARYLVLEHDGSWRRILGQVQAVHAEASRAAAAGEAPVVLVIDSMTAEWDMLKDWVSTRARESKTAKRKIEQDPDAEIKPPMNLWNDAADRHQTLMRMLMTFPGIAIMTARGKETAALDDNGRPIPNEKSYRVEGHKTLAFDASAWVRLSRDAAPRVVGVRSVKAGVRPGVDKALPRPDFTIEWLVFDLLGCGKDTQPRNLVTAPDLATLEDIAGAANTVETVREAWALAADSSLLDATLPGGGTVRQILTATADQIKAQEAA
ncbi:AAA family ATPase [Prescottella equi]|uniref:AAA family ATPase n=1 Tax=Rhodococcus hoagii TaxID=43767 RepID=UPI000A0F4DA8|nr:AAA family ATPase [Prescottella equi]ORL34998.1 hypothetical protein A6I91_01980 [Prescottella equi]